MKSRIMLIVLSGILISALAGCGEKSGLATELDAIEFEAELPAVGITDCRYLAQADDEVYKQQIAACELYNEAYKLTNGNVFKRKYRDVNATKVFHACYDKRREMNLKIATTLNDNVKAMIYSVEDCDNIPAYLRRVIDDTEDFYDYYDAYVNADGDIDPACRILTAFYERSNILAFRFMKENKDDMIHSAVQKIVKNSLATEDLNKYISENNDLVKALNIVYGGVSEEYGELITNSEIRLVRRMLEEANKFAADDIDKLMRQLGEPTEEPKLTPSPEPTEEPTEKPTEKPTEIPVRTIAPERTVAPAPTAAPVIPTRAPSTAPPTQAPVEEPAQIPTEDEPEVQATSEVYIFN